MEKSLVIIKPDGVQRGLIGEVISRLERRGLKLVGAKLVKVSKELAGKHYAMHQGKTFYDGLIAYITSAPVMVMVWEGPDAIAAIRQTMGNTRPVDALPGSVRHDFALTVGKNITHASDSNENARSEIELWFNSDEILNWDRPIDPWIFIDN